MKSTDPKIWRAQDGREIPIIQMSNEHVLNTIRYLRRHAPAYKARMIVMYMRALQVPHGDEAEMALDQEFENADEQSSEEHLIDAVPQYETLLAEAARRGLPVGDFDDVTADANADEIVLRSLPSLSR